MSELYDECESLSPSIDLIRQLVHANPDAVQHVRNDDLGWIPLHVAFFDAYSGSDKGTRLVEVVQFLVEQWPDSVKALGNDGNVALHHACFNDAPLEVVQYLVGQWQDSIRSIDSNGNLPLHHACVNMASLDVVQYLVEKWPNSVKTFNNDRHLPVFLACSNSQLDVVQFLAKQWPEALFIKQWPESDEFDGHLLLHRACVAAPLEVIQYCTSNGQIGSK